MIINGNAGTHDMYLPSKRAKPTPPRVAKNQARSDLPSVGDRSEREKWMRAKQAKKRLTKWERSETMLANRRPDPAPIQREDDINEAEHSKKEGQYERALVFQALRAANEKGVT